LNVQIFLTYVHGSVKPITKILASHHYGVGENYYYHEHVKPFPGHKPNNRLSEFEITFKDEK